MCHFRLLVKEYDMPFTCESYTGGGGLLCLELVLAAADALSEIRVNECHICVDLLHKIQMQHKSH